MKMNNQPRISVVKVGPANLIVRVQNALGIGAFFFKSGNIPIADFMFYDS